MPHVLPPLGHPARDLFDIADLVAITLGERPVPYQIHAMRCAARRVFEASPAANRVAFIRLRSDDDQLELISFGRRGGWKRHWVFGPVGRNARLAA
jgi:hypothetical protein